VTATEFQLRLVDWQFFVTFTWKPSKLGSIKSRERDLWEFLRTWAIREGCRLAQLPVALRWERGELGDRPHAHALLSGFPVRSVSLNTCFRQHRLWLEAYGLFSCRLYRPRQERNAGEAYMLKMRIADARNKYEVRKFDMADRLVINEAAWALMLSTVGADYAQQAQTV